MYEFAFIVFKTLDCCTEYRNSHDNCAVGASILLGIAERTHHADPVILSGNNKIGTCNKGVIASSSDDSATTNVMSDNVAVDIVEAFPALSPKGGTEDG